MPDKRPRRDEYDRWWSFRLTAKDLADAGLEDRERGPEAEARHTAYVQNGFATLAPTRELLRYGAWAGLQVGAAALAVETALLFGIIFAAYTVDNGALANLYGQTPLSGTPLEPLWPVALSLPALPFFAALGALAALLRRAGNRRRRALDRYFTPVSPRLDFLAFWLLISALLLASFAALGMVSAQSDPFGVLILTLGGGALVAFPTHTLWKALYLPLIRRRGSASMETIREHIRRQVVER